MRDYVWLPNSQTVSDVDKKSKKRQKKKCTATNESPEDFIDTNTPTGQKKLFASKMAKQYSTSAVKNYMLAFHFTESCSHDFCIS